MSRFPDAVTASPLSEVEHQMLFEHHMLSPQAMAARLDISLNSFHNYRLKRSKLPYLVRYALEQLQLDTERPTLAESFAAEARTRQLNPLSSYIGGLFLTCVDPSIAGHLYHLMKTGGVLQIARGFIVPPDFRLRVQQKLPDFYKKGGFCNIELIKEDGTLEGMIHKGNGVWETLSECSERARQEFTSDLTDTLPENPYADLVEDVSETPAPQAPRKTALPAYLQQILDENKR